MKQPVFAMLVALAVLATVSFTALGAVACYGALTGAGNPVSQMRDMMRGVGGMNGMMRGMMGGGEDTANAPASSGGMNEPVAIRDFAFAPGNLQVPAGAKITWTNFDDAPHTASAGDGSWDTGILKKGDHGTITFDKNGDYSYYCKVHPNMKARIVVR